MIYNPLKGKIGWHRAQSIYLACGETRAIKAGGGSGNIPLVIIEYEHKRQDTLPFAK